MMLRTEACWEGKLGFLFVCGAAPAFIVVFRVSGYTEVALRHGCDSSAYIQLIQMTHRIASSGD